MGKFINLTGQKFGRLTVIKRVPNNKYGGVMWLCECSCKEKKKLVVRGSSLRSGCTQSCGCLQRDKVGEIGRSRKINMAGKRFGRLVARGEVGKDKWGDYLYKCECDCGSFVVVPGKHLRSGNTQSCGCLQRDKARESYRRLAKSRRIKMVGRRFGRLVVKREAGRNSRGEYLYKCECDCENIIIVLGRSLRCGATRSCGCFNRERASEVMKGRVGENHPNWNPDREEVERVEKVRQMCRNLLRNTLKSTGKRKNTKTDKTNGFTKEEFWAHTEPLLKPGWTIENYGKVWENDHIKPISAFVKEGVTDPKIINALENLRPLSVSDNRKKSNSLVVI